MKKISKIIFAIGLILIILSSNAGAAGIAVSPSKIEMDDVLKGAEPERVLTVFNTATYEDTFTLTVTGDLIDWISFYRMDNPTNPINNVTIPAEDKALVLVKFAIPADTAAGDGYTSKIYVQSIPPEAEAGQAAVMIKMPVYVAINVTGTQTLAGTVESIATTDTEVNVPLRIRVDFRNTGNVIAKPTVNVDISRDGAVVDSVTYLDKEVAPNRKETVRVEWDTAEIKSGDYVAKVSVLLGGEVLETKELPFKLFPPGELTRRGNLTGITCEGDPAVGAVTKILATFVNTGGIATMARFTGEVYVDGNLVDTIESNELLVPIGASETLTPYLKIASPGSYVVKGHVEYEGRTTDTKELSFDVSSAAATTDEEENGTNSTPGFGAAGGLSALLILIVVLRKRTTR
ncbi:MAG: CARDB domain-containing protein [Candidatus Methanogasteraceae archaeon]